MKIIVFFIVLVFTIGTADGQHVYTIKADSIKLTGCDSTEVIIENHTQNVKGFLYNTGNGRTIFKKGVVKISDSLFLIGGDTLRSRAWMQGGNRYGAIGILGTLDNNPLDIYTNNKFAGRITARGQLAIATDGSGVDTLSKLIIGGKTIQLGGFSTWLGNGLVFDPDGAMARIFAARTIEYQSNALGDHHLFVNNIADQFAGTLVTLDPRSSPLAKIDTQLVLKILGRQNTIALNVNCRGYTGIGTQLPTAQLHTTGTVRFAGLTNQDTLSRVIVSDANGNLYYRNASSLAMGDIIGSSLAVNGAVRARSLTLTQTGWPDYVFDSAYRLMPLSEVEKYVWMHKHLPGVPSAAVIERDGFSVGDSQAALLKKIEELTLYTIEQDKKIAAQKNEVGSLQNEVESLRQEMAELKKMIAR